MALRKGMAGRILTLGLLIGGVLAVSTARASFSDRIVAVVNNDILVLSELNEAFAPVGKRIEDTYKGRDKAAVIEQTRLQVLNSLIDNRLIEQQATRSGISVTDTEVSEMLRDMLRRKQMTMDDLLAALAKEDLRFEDYKREFRSQAIRMRVLSKEVRSRIMIREEEIGAYYREHQSSYEGQEAVSLRQILLRVPDRTSPEGRAALRAAADIIDQRLKRGESFDAVAAQSGQGGLTMTDGDLGFVEKGTMLPEVDAVAFRLRIGEISDVIESPMGFHIIQVLDRKGGGLKPLEKVREEIRMKIEEEKAAKRYDEWISDLRKKAHIEIRL